MLDTFRKRLLLLNALVFSVILIVSSLAVYWSVDGNINEDVREDLQVLTDTIVSSIELPEPDRAHDAPAEGVPDALVGYGLKENAAGKNVCLQWFDPQLVKKGEKGSLPVNEAWSNQIGYQVQKEPHALLLTRAVKSSSGKLIGYLRVGISLSEADVYERKLLTGLVSGTIFNLLLSIWAITWLVKQSMVPMEVSIKKLSRFGADASHELKSPLMAIKTNATVALKYSDDMRPKDREKFELILNAADQMNATTSALLHLAKSEDELVRSKLTTVNLNALLAEISGELSNLSRSRNTVIELPSESHEYSLSGNKDDLKIVLKNVVENAIRYSKDQGHVNVMCSREGPRIKIEVADDGIGISEEDLPKIFDRFWRSDKARNHADGGSGLGLAIVESIVTRYGGSITAKSRLGSGSTFSIYWFSA